MGWKWLGGAEYSPIGLDLGRRGVRAAQLERRRGAGRVRVRSAFWDWPAAWRPRAGIGGLGDWMAEAPAAADLAGRLRRLVRQHDFRGRAVVVGLSSPEVEFHALELPVARDAAGGDELRQAVRFELQRLMSLEKDDIQCDYWPVPPSKSSTTTAMGVAARKRDVQAACRVCRDAALECRRVDAAVCALARFAAWSHPPGEAGDARRLTGALDLGERQARLVLSIGVTPVLVRTFDSGCETWVRRLSESLDLTPEAAEIHLRDHGLRSIGRGLRAGEESAPPTQLGGIIRNVLRGELQTLCQEIERSFRYALQCYPDHVAAELVLAGGGSGINHLAAFLAERLGITVVTAAERWAASLQGAGGAREDAGVLACALGLAVEPGGRP